MNHRHGYAPPCASLFLLAALGLLLVLFPLASAGSGPPEALTEGIPMPGQPGPDGAPASQKASGFLLTEGESLSLGIGLSAGDSPYKNYASEWTPLPLLYYEGEFLYLRGTRAGLKLLNLPHAEASVFAGYDGTSFASSDTSDSRLRRLDNRYPGAELGAEARLLTPLGMLFARAAGDVTGHSGGLRGAVGYANSWEYGSFEFAPSAGVYWSDSAYNDYYYGVNGGESRKSGLGAYNAGAGTAPFLGATLSYDIAENWGIFWSGEMVFLSSAVKNSPMVGKSRTHSMTFGLMYGF